eukprot:56067_1
MIHLPVTRPRNRYQANIQSTPKPLLRNSVTFLNDPISKIISPLSQNQYFITSTKLPSNGTTKSLRRSKRMKNRDALTNININISQNIQTWNCKCCGQPDIQDTKFECTRCHSLKSESLFNVDSNNKYIVSGYCRAENECQL